MYVVEESQRATKFLEKLDADLRERIRKKLRKLGDNPVPRDAKFIGGALGGVGLSTLAALQYFNNDEHEGKLVIRDPMPKDKLLPQPRVKPINNLEGLARVVEQITNGLENNKLGENLYKMLVKKAQQSPLSSTEETYRLNRNGFFAGRFMVFDEFKYRERKIQPKKSLMIFSLWEISCIIN